MSETKTRRLLRVSVLFFVLSDISRVWGGMVVQACFSPREKCSNHIVRELDRAEREILVALYAFTSKQLAWALVRAKGRGVDVRVILDREFDQENKFSKGAFLRKRALPVRLVSGSSKGNRDTGLMHQKFTVIDARVVLTGSYNWTASAENFNDENLLLFRDAGPLAEEYRKEFFRLWERTS